MLQSSHGLFIVKVKKFSCLYSVGVCGCLTGQPRFTFLYSFSILLMYLWHQCAGLSSILSCYSLVGLRRWLESIVNIVNHYNILASQNSLLMDRKRSRSDILTTDFAQMGSWPGFMLTNGIHDENPCPNCHHLLLSKPLLLYLVVITLI